MPGDELVHTIEQLSIERQGNLGFGHNGMTRHHTILKARSNQRLQPTAASFCGRIRRSGRRG